MIDETEPPMQSDMRSCSRSSGKSGLRLPCGVALNGSRNRCTRERRFIYNKHRERSGGSPFQKKTGDVRMSQRVLAILATFLLFASSGMAAPKLLENIPLVWKPTDTLSSLGPLNLGGPVVSTALHVDPLVDMRNNPSLIAENREKDD